MHPSVQKLHEVAGKKSRLIIGLMSGTSLDGLDIALCDITGTGTSTQVKLIQFETVLYSMDFKEKVLSVFSKQNVSLELLTVLNPWIANQQAIMINQTIAKWGIKNSQVDLLASHGQTIYHAPKILHPNDDFGTATLQIGDGDHLAVATGIITLSDFRQKHIAAGGDGAPLSVYGDYLIASDATENRLLLNIGGIANFTHLPASCKLSEVFSTDTGPGNTIMDAYMRAHFNLPYDKDGLIASKGIVNEKLLKALESNWFFKAELPKTTGPELFNIDFLIAAQKVSQTEFISDIDVMATLNKFTANTIADAIQKYLVMEQKYEVYVSGGGMHNTILMNHLRQLLPNINIQTSQAIGLQPDAKEAILFALLANECIAGEPMFAGVNATKIPVSMGKISLPF